MFSIKCFLNLHLLLVTVWNMKIRLSPVFSSAKASHREPAKMTQFLSSFVPAEELLLFIELSVFPMDLRRFWEGWCRSWIATSKIKNSPFFSLVVNKGKKKRHPLVPLKTNPLLEVVWNGVGQMAKITTVIYSYRCSIS